MRPSLFPREVFLPVKNWNISKIFVLPSIPTNFYLTVCKKLPLPSNAALTLVLYHCMLRKASDHITQCLMKKDVKETKGIKGTNRMHQTSFQLCDGGGSCVITLNRGLPQEGYSSFSIKWWPRVWFHRVLSSTSRKAPVPGVRQCDFHSIFGVFSAVTF